MLYLTVHFYPYKNKSKKPQPRHMQTHAHIHKNPITCTPIITFGVCHFSVKIETCQPSKFQFYSMISMLSGTKKPTDLLSRSMTKNIIL